MKSWNYVLLMQQAKDLEKVANHFFTTIPDTDEWEDALSDFITQAGYFGQHHTLNHQHATNETNRNMLHVIAEICLLQFF